MVRAENIDLTLGKDPPVIDGIIPDQANYLLKCADVPVAETPEGAEDGAYESVHNDVMDLSKDEISAPAVDMRDKKPTAKPKEPRKKKISAKAAAMLQDQQSLKLSETAKNEGPSAASTDMEVVLDTLDTDAVDMSLNPANASITAPPAVTPSSAAVPKSVKSVELPPAVAYKISYYRQKAATLAEDLLSK